METDAVLMEWSVRGRPDAFVDVVRRHEVAVHAFLARRAGRETADDLLAEVEPPAAAVLENAREVLWSAVASVMLELDPVEDAMREPRTMKPPSRRRRPDRER